MAELVWNPNVMKKLQDEIRSCIKEDSVKEIDLEKFEYLKMVVKEVLRMHPPASLLLPRETISPFKLKVTISTPRLIFTSMCGPLDETHNLGLTQKSSFQRGL